MAQYAVNSALFPTLKSQTFNQEITAGYFADNFRPAALVPIPVKPGQESLDVLVLNKTETTIGRDTSCDHAIVSVEISRKHALIKYENNSWWISDLNSTNGLLVQGTKIKPLDKVALEDGFSVCFGPIERGIYKYIFRENYTEFEHHHSSQICIKSAASQEIFIDPSGYESVSTQDLNARSTPPDLNFEVEKYKSEINRLKMEKSIIECQLKEQRESNRIINNQHQMTQRTLSEKETKYNKKISNLNSMITKYRTLIDQFKQSSQSKCAIPTPLSSSDDESSTELSKASLSPSTASNMLREMICSICSEYLITPTTLNCSHVFCLHCIDAWKHEYRIRYNPVSNGICPVCRKEVQCQTQALAFENIINMMLGEMLTKRELEDRRKLMEERKQKPLVSASNGASQQSGTPSSLSSFLQQILSGLPRSRRSSIVITSDESDDEDDDDNSHDDDSQDVVEIDYNQESGELEVNLDLPSDVEEGDQYDISITVGNLQGVLDGTASDDEIMMIQDDDDSHSNSSEDVYYYIDDTESGQEAIVISDSEDEPSRDTRRRRRRRSNAMIILSDSEEDSMLPALMSQSGTSNQSVSGDSNSAASSSSRRNGGARSGSSRRTHPYRRSGRSNTNNNNSNNASRRATMCV